MWTYSSVTTLDNVSPDTKRRLHELTNYAERRGGSGFKDELDGSFNPSRSLVLTVANEEGAVCGWANISPAGLLGVFIDPAHRRGGLAKELALRIVRYAVANLHPFVWVMCYSDAGNRLYDSVKRELPANTIWHFYYGSGQHLCSVSALQSEQYPTARWLKITNRFPSMPTEELTYRGSNYEAMRLRRE